jgi:glutamine cyclotransferase
MKRRRILWLGLAVSFLILAAVVKSVNLCNLNRSDPGWAGDLQDRMTYEVVNVFPHDPKAFTQGLIYLEGFLYESTGLYGESTLRKVDLETGKVLHMISLSEEDFAEGMTAWEETLVQLTWREHRGYVYERADFTLQSQFNYETEGWGLTHDGEMLIMSDGSALLYFLNPDTFEVERTVSVTYRGGEVVWLNELEYIQGEVYANVWQTDRIIRINPKTGQVAGWIDLAGILPDNAETKDAGVLNGVAYDPETGRLFITGKNWPYLYEIILIPDGSEE